MLRFVAVWVTSTLALALADWLLPTARFDGLGIVLVLALACAGVDRAFRSAVPRGSLSAVVWLFLLNAATLAFASWLLPGARIDDLIAVGVASLLVTLGAWGLAGFGRPRPERAEVEPATDDPFVGES